MHGWLSDSTVHYCMPILRSCTSDASQLACPHPYPPMPLCSALLYPHGCYPCEPGSYCPGGASAPVPCPKGTYEDLIGDASSSDCQPW